LSTAERTADVSAASASSAAKPQAAKDVDRSNIDRVRRYFMSVVVCPILCETSFSRGLFLEQKFAKGAKIRKKTCWKRSFLNLPSFALFATFCSNSFAFFCYSFICIRLELDAPHPEGEGVTARPAA
jgi:hypothetical protein